MGLIFYKKNLVRGSVVNIIEVLSYYTGDGREEI